MTRRHAMLIAIVGAIVFAVIYFWPESTNAGVAGRLHLGDGGIRLGVQIGQPDRHDHWKHNHRQHDHRKRDHWKRDHWRHDHWRHGPPRNWPMSSRRPSLPPSRGVVLVAPYVPAERVIVRETVMAPPPPPAPPPAVVVPPVPLDPQGRARKVSARGGEPPREWVLGAVLPPDLPHVALVPSAYDLPQPPPGQIYARVDGDVLRIEAGTRRIVAVLAR